MIAILLFLICGCLGAVFLGRVQDFVEFMVYADKKTKLPNRSKCDDMINSYEAKPLEDNFTFILIRLDILKQINSQVGRTAGDTLLGEFGRMLGDTAKDYGFVGYNGSDQFMCMFENCSYKKAEMFIISLSSAVEHYNSQNPQQEITFSYAIEESRTTGIYEARGLIAAAFRDINSKSNTNVNAAEKSDKPDKPDKPDDDPDDPSPTDGGGGGISPKPEDNRQTDKPSTKSSLKKPSSPVKAEPVPAQTKAEKPQERKELKYEEKSAAVSEKPYSPVEWSGSQPPKSVYKAVTVRKEREVIKEASPQKDRHVDESAPEAQPEVREVPVVVKSVSAPKAEESVKETENPYAPKPRVKNSYRTREGEDKGTNFDSYAPKSSRSRS